MPQVTWRGLIQTGSPISLPQGQLRFACPRPNPGHMAQIQGLSLSPALYQPSFSRKKASLILPFYFLCFWVFMFEKLIPSYLPAPKGKKS